MTAEHLSAASVVLLGHGTDLNAESAAAVRQHVAELRRRRLFKDVQEAFWKQEPNIQTVLPQLTAAKVFIVPCFMSEGYFSEQVIPRALGFLGEGQVDFGRIQRRGNQSFVYCKPLGTHEGMSAVVLHRAREIVERFPFPRAPKLEELTLFIAGHGTEQNENSRKSVDHQVELLRTQGFYADVQPLFLDQEPRIPRCYELGRTKNLVVVPFFTGDGLHVLEDIPVLLGEPERIVKQRLQNGQPAWRNPTEKKGKRLWYSASVGTDPVMADAIVELVREAADWS